MIYYIGEQRDDVQCCTLEFAYNKLKHETVVGLDIETRAVLPSTKVYKGGLDPYLSDVIMLQIGTLTERFVIDTRKVDPSILFEIDRLYVGHNLKFEGKHLQHKYGIRLKQVYDTMIVEMVLTNGLQLGYSLAKLAERYLNIKEINSINLFEDYNPDEDYLDKSIRLGFIKIGNNDFTYDQIMYGDDDIIYPLKIRDIQMSADYYPETCINLENEFTQVLADIELVGMNFEPEKWGRIYETKVPVLQSAKKKLDDYVVNNHPKFAYEIDLFSKKPKCKIQWSSSDQCIKLFRHMDICPQERSKQTKKKEWTVGAKALSKLIKKENKDLFYKQIEVDIVDSQTFILEYLRYKKLEQACTTFGPQWFKYIHPVTKRVHSSYRQIMNTGRMSSTNPQWGLYMVTYLENTE